MEQTEKGWFIQYIDRDPETLKRQDMLAKKAKMEKTDEERLNEFIERQVERAKANAADNSDSDEDKVKSSELKRENEDEKSRIIFLQVFPKCVIISFVLQSFFR